MEEFCKVIFVCKENTSLSPMAEWIFKSILMDKNKEIISRGLVVLFPEPRNVKATDILVKHGIPCEEQVTKEFLPEEADAQTLVVAMNFTEKVQLIEEFETANVYTLHEFVDEEGEVTDPYGGDESAYEDSYIQLKDLLYKMKKKLEWD